MKVLFVGFLNVSLSGSLIICLVTLLRLVFRRAPKAFICILWVLAMFRLLLPFQIESALSLRPDVPTFTVRDTELTMDISPVPEENIPDFIPQMELGSTKTVAVDYITIAGYLWAVIALSFGAYAGVSYIRLKHRMREAVRFKERIYIASGLDTAILLGYFRPRIYLPDCLDVRKSELVIAHEEAHRKRRDNWWKLLGFICVCVHWFNPLVWVAYGLLCKDIESACDEYVIRELDIESRKLYSSALLSCGSKKMPLISCPVAFGEISIRKRIIDVLNYRKPTLWITVAVVIAIILTAVLFITDPVADYPPYYEKMISSLGKQIDTVCEELGIPETSGETPIVVEYLGIPFKLCIYADELRSDNAVYAFEYVAEYKDDSETASRDIVTIARYHWRHFGEGLNADKKRYPQILSYITEEDVAEQIKINQNRETEDRIINDNWDVTKSCSYKVKEYLAEFEMSEKYTNSIDISEDSSYLSPYLAYSMEAFVDTQTEETDVVKIVLRYNIQAKDNRENKFFATYIEDQTWWDKFVSWLK